MSAALRVLAGGSLTTVQDLGRTGLAHLGVPRAGALDGPAAAAAHRLVGNRPDAALLELTWGGLDVVLEARAGRWVALTGAPAELRVDDRAVALGAPVWLPAGSRLQVGTPSRGVRSLLAVAGGVDVAPVLGSRSTDTLAWVGPPQVRDGALLPLGPVTGPPAVTDVPVPAATAGTVVLRVRRGPRTDWLGPHALAELCAAPYVVAEQSNRVGLRLDGPPLPWARDEELPSEGIVLGAVQVPPDGRPVVFLADHPTTGGYPVLAVVETADLPRCAQLRPGDPVRFTAA